MNELPMSGSNAHPETIITMPSKPGSNKHKTFRVLFGMCATSSLLAPELLSNELKGHAKNTNNKSKWKTGMGELVSEGTARMSKTSFPSFATQRQLDMEFNLLPKQKDHSCHVIIGMKDLKRLGIAIDLKEEMMKWDGVSIPMVPKGRWTQASIDNCWRNYQKEKEETFAGEPELEAMVEGEEVNALEANVYQPANITEFTENNKCDHLSELQKEKLTALLRKHEQLFQGKRGKWKGGDATLRLKSDSKPHMAKPYPVPLPQREEFKKELGRQCAEETLRKLPPLEAEESEWGLPIFGAPKKDEKQARTVGDFRVLNAMLNRSPCYIEPTHESLRAV